MKYLSLLVIPVVTLTTLLLVQVSGLSVPMRVTTTSGTPADFSVVGEGKVDVIPDIGYIDVGVVVNRAESPEAAQNQISAVNNKLIEVLGTYGVQKKDIQTSNFSINPSYDYSSNSSGVINGYNGTAQLSITVRKVDTLGDIAKAATANGANEIYNVRFNVEDPAKYREAARTNAIENAQDQAKKLAKQLGIKLGKVTNVVESTADSQTPVYYEKAMGLGGGGGTANLQPGSQIITSTVTLYFEKK